MIYSELKQAVQDYLESSETKFVNNIPMFTKMVENRIYNEVQIPALRKNVTGQCTAGNKYLTVPTDYLASFSISLTDTATGETVYPMLKDVNLIREVYPLASFVGVPKYYAQFDENTLIFGPTPDKAYSAELHYFYYPETMVTASESWLSENYPSVILYGVIAEAYRFQKGDAAQQKVYDDQYMQALNLLRGQGGRSRNEAYSNNQPKPSVPVGE